MTQTSLKVAIAEDEPLNLRRLERLLKAQGCEVLASFTSGAAVLSWVQSRPDVDALFLDIRMPGASGLEVLRAMKDPIPVVMVTAFSEHAVEAYEGDAVDYLLKPVSPERLQKSLERIRRRSVEPSADSQPIPSPNKNRRFPVKAGEGMVFLEISKTTHFEVLDEVVYAHAGGRFQTAWEALSQVETAFPETRFLRIQRHLLVRQEAVVGIKPTWSGSLTLTLAGGLELEASRRATPRIKEALGLA